MIILKYKFFHSILFVFVMVITTMLFFGKLNILSIAMLLMLPILFSAIFNSQKEVFTISVVTIICFNVLFIPPRFSLSIHDPNYIISFIVMIAIGQIVSFFVRQAQNAKESIMSQKIQDALLESLSHELRTPLAVISGSTHALMAQDLELKSQDRYILLETIQENAEEMEREISSLISSAKLKNGILQLTKEYCDIEEIIGSALLKTEKGQYALLEIKSELPPILGNAIFLEQAIVNLLDNAFKYGYDVTLEAKEELSMIVIEVCNKGKLPTHFEISQATKAFTRLSNSYSKRGLGLGLHVVSLIANIHKGTLDMQIKKDKFCAKLFLSKNAT